MKHVRAVLIAIAAICIMAGCGAKKEEDRNPFGHLRSKQQARETLGKPRESKAMLDLPAKYAAELERLQLNQKAKSFDSFTQFRTTAGTSLGATPGIYHIYVVYDESDGVVYTFRQFLD
jgi:hypothetical protein